MFKKILPHICFLAFSLIAIWIYFSPFFFQGKVLQQMDIEQWSGAAKEIIDYRTKTGEEPLWTNSIFSGMPAYLISTEHPGNKIIRDISHFVHYVVPHPYTGVFLMLINAYIFCLILGLSPWLAGLGAIMFAFSSFTFISLEAGHNSKIYAMAYVPLICGGIIATYQGKWKLGLPILGLGLALQLPTNHLQITYYALICAVIIGFVFMVFSILEKKIVPFLRNTLFMAVVAGVAVGTNLGALMTIYEYGKYSIRGKSELTPLENNEEVRGDGLDRDYAFKWSSGIAETFTLLIPNFYGGSSAGALDKSSATFKALKENGVPEESSRDFIQRLPLYWGDMPFTSGPIYLGVLVWFLFVIGLFLVDKKYKYVFLSLAAISLLLAWGKNFSILNYILFDYLPGYNKFRAPSMALFIIQFALAFFAVLALKAFFENPDKENVKKTIQKSFYILSGFCGSAVLLSGMLSFSAESDESLRSMAGDWLVQAIRDDRQSLLRNDAIRTLLIAGAIFGVLFYNLKGKISQNVTVLILAFITLAELWNVDKRYLNQENFIKKSAQAMQTPSEIDMMIMADTTKSYRVFNMNDPFNENRTASFHKAIGGYSPAKLRRYQDVIERHLAQNNIKVFQMLNAKYMISNDPKEPVSLMPTPLGNAWFVSKIIKVNNPNQEISALSNFEPKNEAILDVSKFPIQQENFDTLASITLDKYSPRRLTYSAQVSQSAFCVFSEIYYEKGWEAKVDGKNVPILRVNYLLRALQLEAGKHTITFEFNPQTYYSANKIGSICSLVLLSFIAIVMGFTLYDTYKKSV